MPIDEGAVSVREACPGVAVVLRTAFLTSGHVLPDISKKHIKWDLEIKKISLEIDGKKIIDVSRVPRRRMHHRLQTCNPIILAARLNNVDALSRCRSICLGCALPEGAGGGFTVVFR